MDIWQITRRFYSWAARRRGVVDVGKVLERPIQPRMKDIATLSNREIDEVLFANQRRPREDALLRFLLDTGARAGEAASLQWRDFSWSTEEGYAARVRGKRGERRLFVGGSTYEALERLGGDPLWRGGYGKLTLDGLKKVVRKAMKRAGLGGGAQMLRHTFAKLYIQNGGSLFGLMVILGHRQLRTTERYVGFDMRDVAAEHARFSPMAGRVATQLRLVEFDEEAGRAG